MGMKITTLQQDIDGVNSIRDFWRKPLTIRGLKHHIKLCEAVNDRRRRIGARLCVSENSIQNLKDYLKHNQ